MKENESWTGFNVDLCKAVGVALWGEGGEDKVEISGYSPEQVYSALKHFKVDLLVGVPDISFRTGTASVSFVATTFYDSQGFMVPKNLGVYSATKLDGATICVVDEDAASLATIDFFADNNLRYKRLLQRDFKAFLDAYAAGDCDVAAASTSLLSSMKHHLETPQDHMVLPEITKNFRNGIVVRKDDSHFAQAGSWALNALVLSERLGITSSNIADIKDPPWNRETTRFLRVPSLLSSLDDPEYNYWTAMIVEKFGNYGELFSRNIGDASTYNLHRGLNSNWIHGGLHRAEAFATTGQLAFVHTPVEKNVDLSNGFNGLYIGEGLDVIPLDDLFFFTTRAGKRLVIEFDLQYSDVEHASKILHQALINNPVVLNDLSENFVFLRLFLNGKRRILWGDAEYTEKELARSYPLSGVPGIVVFAADENGGFSKSCVNSGIGFGHRNVKRLAEELSDTIEGCR